MKKLVLGASALGLLAAAQSDAKMGGAFDGMYTGIRGTYQWHSSDFKLETGTTTSKELKANSFGGDVLVGWMTGSDWTYGFEAFLGYQSASDKGDTTPTGTNYTAKIDRKWRYGLDLLVGHKFMTDLTGYAKFGIHANVTDFNTSVVSTGADGKNDKSEHMPALAAGLGVKYALNNDFTLDVGYVYEHDLQEHDYKIGGAKTGKYDSGSAHQVNVGVTFTF